MRKTWNQFTALAGLTALETMRQPICLILSTISLGLIAVLPVAIAHRFGESSKLIRDSALAIHLLSGLVLATYAASTTIVQEIRRGTVASILAKPVSRELFILAKFFGIALVMIFYSVMIGMATLISARSGAAAFHTDVWSAIPIVVAPVLAYLAAGAVNFFTQRPFSSNAFVIMFVGVTAAFIFTGFFTDEGALQSWGEGYQWRVIPASVLVTFAVLLLQAIATALSTRLQAIPALSICTVIFFIGLVSQYFFGRMADENVLANVAYRLLPDFQHFWMADALNMNGEEAGTIPWSYIGKAAGYAGLYLGGLLLLTVCALRSMEIK